MLRDLLNFLAVTRTSYFHCIPYLTVQSKTRTTRQIFGKLTSQEVSKRKPTQVESVQDSTKKNAKNAEEFQIMKIQIGTSVNIVFCVLLHTRKTFGDKTRLFVHEKKNPTGDNSFCRRKNHF